MVWQVRQALLNASCPSSPAVALPAGVWPSDGWETASMAAASETVSAPEVMRCAHAKERLQTSRVNVSSHGAFRRCVELGRPQQPGSRSAASRTCARLKAAGGRGTRPSYCCDCGRCGCAQKTDWLHSR